MGDTDFTVRKNDFSTLIILANEILFSNNWEKLLILRFRLGMSKFLCFSHFVVVVVVVKMAFFNFLWMKNAFLLLL